MAVPVCRIWVLVIALGVWGSPAVGQTPLGSQFQVNTNTPFHQLGPRIARAADGDFVIVWNTAHIAQQNDVAAQRYSSSGTKIGGEMAINTYTPGSQGGPVVASEPDGDFVVAWASNGGAGDADGFSIRARRFSSNGTPKDATEFQVNAGATSHQTSPSIAMKSDGDFVVTFESYAFGGYARTLGRRFASSGSAIGGEFEISTNHAALSYITSVGSDVDGDFVVAWQEYNFSSPSSHIKARRFSSDGSPLGGPFTVASPATPTYAFDPSIFVDDDGDFVVTWADENFSVSGSGEIRARGFDSGGAERFAEFQVNTLATNRQSEPGIAGKGNGDFTVIWKSDVNAADSRVRARSFSSSGVGFGNDFQVNDFTPGEQRNGALSFHTTGEFVATWDSTQSPENDNNAGPSGNDSGSIQARFFTAPPVSGIDLSIAKTDSADPVNAGAAYSYSLSVSNADAPATNVVVTDTLPAGVGFASATGTGWSCGHSMGTVTCTRPSLAVGAAPAITVNVTAPAEGGMITNNASVSADEPDANAMNDNASETTTVTAVADVSITKGDSADPVNAGSAFSYTLNVSNAGPSTATTVTVVDTLPAGVGFTSASGTDWMCGESMGTVTCTRPTLGVGGAPAITVNVTAPAEGGMVTNNVGVSADQTDPNSMNDNASETTTVTAVADLSITKGDSADPVDAGSAFSYALNVSNAGPSTATIVTVIDTLPAGVGFTSASGTEWMCGESMGTVTCTRPTLAVGAAPVITVSVTAPAEGGMITNNAGVSATESDPTTPNDASETTTVTAIADLSISKSDSADPVDADSAFSYTLDVSNAGPSTATSVAVADTLPAGVGFTGASGTGWTCGEAGGVVTCTRPSLATGAAPAITINVTAPVSTGMITNNVTVSATTTDPTTPNQASEPTTVQASADLSITKSDSPDPVDAAATLTYTLEVSNAGPSDATTISVTDTLPAGVTYLSAVGTGWTCGEVMGTVTCTRPTLAVGPAPAITIEVTAPDQGGGITNDATVTSSTGDPTTPNEASEGTTVTALADLAIDKMDSEDPVIGTSFSYTLEVTNNGPSDAVNVVATDVLPVGAAFVSSGDGCTEAVGTVTCPYGTIAASATVSRSFVVELDTYPNQPPSPLSNTATVSSDTSDPASANDADEELSTLDVDPPVITALDTIVGSGDGQLDECETIRVPIGALEIQVQDDLSPLLGLDDPMSYRLLGSGPDGDFGTTSCTGAPVGDDVPIEIVSLSLVSVDPVDVTATLGLGTSNGLMSGLYRLLVCDAITDEAGNPLDADANATPGGDLVLDFRADPFNLFANGHFDDCAPGGVTVSPWITVTTPPDTITPSAAGEDVDGSPRSGSIEVTSLAPTPQTVGQCVALGAGTYDLRARFRFAAGTAIGIFQSRCELFDGPVCTGSTLDVHSSVLVFGDTAGGWLASASELQAPAGTASALCDFAFEPFSDAQPAFDAGLDALFLGDDGVIFTDGFESGDTSAWSSAP